jgi:hypothetical protein
VVCWLAALIVPVMLLTAPLVGAADKKPNPDKDKDADKKDDKLVKVGVVSGKVMAIYEDKRKLRLQVTIPHTKLNAAALVGVQQAQQQMTQASARRDIRGMLTAQQQMAMHQRNLYTIEKITQEIEFQALDDVVVRTAKPRDQFDDKGKVKKLTKAELKELKGDPKTPGYKAEFGDLMADQTLQVTVVRKKDAPAAKAPRPKKKKGKDDDVDAADLAGEPPQVSFIMIVADPPPAK